MATNQIEYDTVQTDTQDATIELKRIPSTTSSIISFDPISPEELHEHMEDRHASSMAQFVKNIMFGGIDGVITTFAIISAGVGANLDTKVVLIMGLANLVADGFSMGFGDFLSSRAERSYILSEKAKEEHEYHHNLLYEKRELAGCFVEKGLAQKDAFKMVNIVAKPTYKEFFLELMLNHELDLPVPDDIMTIYTQSFLCFLSFIVFGSIPVGVYFAIATSTELTQFQNFMVCCCVCAVALFFIGVTGSVLSKQPWLYQGFSTMGNGMCAALIAYGIGALAEHALS